MNGELLSYLAYVHDMSREVHPADSFIICS